MIVTTTQSVEGMRIVEYKGIVCGEVISQRFGRFAHHCELVGGERVDEDAANRGEVGGQLHPGHRRVLHQFPGRALGQL